ncbi:hypothetical protein Tco_0981841 [Tanacetum coccineum]
MSQIDGMDSTNAKKPSCSIGILMSSFSGFNIKGHDCNSKTCLMVAFKGALWCDDLASRPSQAAIEEKTTVIHVIPTKSVTHKTGLDEGGVEVDSHIQTHDPLYGLGILRMFDSKLCAENANKDDIQKLIPAEVSPEIQRLLTLLQNSMESGEKIF